jgi:hypothetical protein
MKLNRRNILRKSGLALLSAGAIVPMEPEAIAQWVIPKPEEWRATDGSPLDTGTSEIRPVIERYDVELRDLNRVYATPGSSLRQSKLEKF